MLFRSAAVPFGARYRVIDFVLSGMVNADIRNIGVITTLKYGSLMGHIRSGEVWDLNRKNSALTVLPPFSGHEADRMHDSRMEALHGNMPYLRHIHEKYILLSGSNYIANMNFSAMLEQHVRSGAVVTAVCTRQPVTMSPDVMRTQYRLGDDGHVLRLKQKKGLEDGAFAATNTYIMERKTLMQIGRAHV